jgi:hypothetical protein
MEGQAAVLPLPTRVTVAIETLSAVAVVVVADAWADLISSRPP